jgi:hypothetical protein
MKSGLCPLCKEAYKSTNIISDASLWGEYAFCEKCKTWQESWAQEDGGYTIFLLKNRPYDFVASTIQMRLNDMKPEVPPTSPHYSYYLTKQLANYSQELVEKNIKLFAEFLGIEEKIAEGWLRGTGFIKYELKPYNRFEDKPIVNE